MTVSNTRRPVGQEWVEKAEAGDFEGAILAYVEATDHVSFAELEKRMEPYMPVKGHECLTLGSDPNLIFWADMSKEFSQTLLRLFHQKKLYGHPSSLMVYLIDGEALTLPIAKRPPKRGYKEPRWCPIVLRTVPIPP